MMKSLITAFVAFFILLSAPSFSSEWRVARTFGDVRYVLIPVTAENDKAFYLGAIKDLCTPDKLCVLQFWSNEKLLPTESEDRMSAESIDARSAVYIYNPESGFRSLTFACRVEYGPERCRRYIPPKSSMPDGKEKTDGGIR